MRRLTAAIVAFCACAVALYAQRVPGVPELLEVFADDRVVWNPLWPAELPPDAFVVDAALATRVRSITVEVQVSSEASLDASPQASPQAMEVEPPLLVCAWTADGRLAARPVFWIDSTWAAELTRGAGGQVDAYALRPLSEADDASDGIRVRIKPESYTIEQDGETTIVAIGREYGVGALDAIEETFFDEGGVPLALNRWSMVGDRVVAGRAVAEDGTETEFLRLDRDAEGRVTRIWVAAGVAAVETAAAESVRESAYSSDGKPRELRIDDSIRRFQWDERGLLVRETLRSVDGAVVEWRYEYSFDRYGSWIERKGIGYRALFGTLVPDRSGSIIRKINYR